MNYGKYPMEPYGARGGWQQSNSSGIGGLIGLLVGTIIGFILRGIYGLIKFTYKLIAG